MKLEAAKAFVRSALSLKTGHDVADGPLLDRLAVWGAGHGVSTKWHMDQMARVDRPASYIDGQGPAGVVTGESSDIHGKTADDLLVMLGTGGVSEADLLTLYGISPA